MSDDSVQTCELHDYLARMKEGDLQAREDLARRICHRMELLARKMLKSFPNVKRWTQTDDVFNSALMRLFRSLERICPANTRDFFNLAAVHVRRELLDLARHFSQANRVEVGLTGGPDDSQTPWNNVVDTGDTPDELEKWCRFHQQVDLLPVEEREVLGLIYYHGWTQQQVGELLAITDRTVRRRMDSALVRLHRSLKEESLID